MPRFSEGVWDLGAADMNADERPDLVLVTGGPGSLTGAVSVLFDPGVDLPPSSWPSVSFDTRGDYGRVAVGDIDGDGINDVAALTFGTHVLRWWLLGPDASVRDERSMSFSGAALPGRVCPGPAALTDPPPTLSSLAFADLDVDGALELAVSGYAGAGEGGLYLFSYRRSSGCFELVPRSARVTRGSLRVRFFDVDDDGELDLVTSHYSLARPSLTRPSLTRDALTRPSLTRPSLTRPGPADIEGPSTPGAAPAAGAASLEWGEWWRQGAAKATPLVARFGNRELLAADPAPELNIVDFDVLRADEGVRFAIAGSAHLCPALDCWSAGHAGFVSVVDGSGRELVSGDAWKQRTEEAPPVPEARLLPRVVAFLGELERPSLAAAFWWGTRSRHSACSRVSACAGPLTLTRLASVPGSGSGSVSCADFGRADFGRADIACADSIGDADPSSAAESGHSASAGSAGSATFAQALAVLAAPGVASEHRQNCQAPKPLLALPSSSAVSIVELRLNGQRLSRASYSWVPGARVVALSRRFASDAGRVCITYATSSRQRLAVADSKRGLLTFPLE